MNTPKVVLFMRSYFPEVNRDLDLPYLYASNVADWYAQNCSDPTIVNRMKNFLTVLSKYPEGKTATDDLGTIVQVGIIEKLWKQKNAAQCLATLFSAKDLTVGADYYKAWIGEGKYNAIISELNKMA